MPDEREAVENAVLIWRRSTSGRAHAVLTLGHMVISKWDLANAKYNDAPTLEQVSEFDNFTKKQMEEFSSDASTMLRELAAIETDSRRPSFWLPIWQGVLAAFIYSILLVVFYVVGSRIGGHDLLDSLRAALGK